MKLSTGKDGDLLSHADKNVETQGAIKGTSINKLLIDNHEKQANRGDVEGLLHLEQFFGFCKTL